MIGPIVLGVDGGGTSTVAWLADSEGRVLGRGTAGPSNAKAIGQELAWSALRQAISAARVDAGVGDQPIEVACLGLAGFDRPEDRSLLAEWVEAEGWANQLLTVNDGDLVLAAGTPEGFGIALISGTGSIAVGRLPEGRSSRAGGWGPLIGDEGSGYSVALAGLRLVARRFDGRSRRPDSDRLTLDLCNALGVATPRDIVSVIYGEDWDRARIAGLSRIVVSAAEADPEIRELILRPAAEELVALVDAVRVALGGEGCSLPLAMAGGFLLSARALQEDVRCLLGNRVGEVRHVPEPVQGAIQLARRALR